MSFFTLEPVLWGIVGISMVSLIPAVFGSEFGFRRLYIKLLVDLFDWATGIFYQINLHEIF